MGQKVPPLSLRLGYVKDWNSRWYAPKGEFAVNLQEDIKIREFIKKNFYQAAIASIEIERARQRVRVIINTARPGIIIGRKGADVDRLRDELHSLTGKEIFVDIKEIKNPNASAQLVAENVAFQLEKRVAFRRAMKKAVQNAMAQGAGGIKIKCAGRLGGAELARREGYLEGKLPLSTLRADIEYGFAEAKTTYGAIGVKCWIYKGEILPKKKKSKDNVAEVA